MKANIWSTRNAGQLLYHAVWWNIHVCPARTWLVAWVQTHGSWIATRDYIEGPKGLFLCHWPARPGSDWGGKGSATEPLTSWGTRPSRTGRVYCPVPGCLHGDAARARGWASVASMQAHIACWGLARRCACSLAPTTASDVASAASACRPGLACTLLAALRLELPPACPVSPMLVTLCLPSMPFCWGALAPSGTCLGQHVTFGQRCSPGHWLWCITMTLGLGKNCSCYPRRCLMLLGSGRKHAKAAAAYTLDRLQRWESGERRELWDSRQPPLAPGGRARTPAQKKELATSLAREGFDNKACAALLAEGLCKENPETVACIQSLHPVAADQSFAQLPGCLSSRPFRLTWQCGRAPATAHFSG